MNRKALMIVSTIAVFILTVVAAFLWLFRVRYIDVVVVSPVGDESSYEFIDEALTERFKGKLIVSVGNGEVKNSFSSYPKVKVVKADKVFPNRLKVTVKIRDGKFLITGDEYSKNYVADDEFFIIETRDKSLDDGELIRVEVSGKDVSEEKLGIGETAQGNADGLFDSAVKIYDSFGDGYTFVKNVIIKHETVNAYVRFETRTGAAIKFYFINPLSSEDPVALRNEICGRAKEARDYYFGLDENKKSGGTIHVIKGRTTFWDEA